MKRDRSWLLVVLIALGSTRLAASPTATKETVEFLAPGEVIAPFTIEGVDGVMREVRFPKGKVTVLLFFSSGCPACHQMLPFWNRAFAQRAKNVIVVGIITAAPPPRFFEKVSIAFPVMLAPGGDFLEQLKVARVPLTLRVAPGGKVADVGVGLLDVIRVGQLFGP